MEPDDRGHYVLWSGFTFGIFRFSPIACWMTKSGGTWRNKGELVKACRILGQKPEGRDLLERSWSVSKYSDQWVVFINLTIELRCFIRPGISWLTGPLRPFQTNYDLLREITIYIGQMKIQYWIRHKIFINFQGERHPSLFCWLHDVEIQSGLWWKWHIYVCCFMLIRLIFITCWIIYQICF
jgi:hypothetical protein